MSRTWTITLLVLFILLLGGLVFLLLDYQKKMNDKEKDLELARKQSKESLETSEKLAELARRLDAGEIGSDEAKKEMAKITGEGLDDDSGSKTGGEKGPKEKATRFGLKTATSKTATTDDLKESIKESIIKLTPSAK